MIDGTVASYPKELTQVMLKPGGGEFVWIDLVYIFCQMWDGPPAYTVVQAKPKLVRRQECKGPLSETSGTQINDVLYLHQYPGCLFILYIIYSYNHFTPAFFYLIPVFCILMHFDPGPRSPVPNSFYLLFPCAEGRQVSFQGSWAAAAYLGGNTKVMPIWRPPVF